MKKYITLLVVLLAPHAVADTNELSCFVMSDAIIESDGAIDVMEFYEEDRSNIHNYVTFDFNAMTTSYVWKDDDGTSGKTKEKLKALDEYNYLAEIGDDIGSEGYSLYHFDPGMEFGYFFETTGYFAVMDCQKTPVEELIK